MKTLTELLLARTPIISVPSKMAFYTSKGKLKEVPTLTRTGAISTRGREKVIKFIGNEEDIIRIDNPGYNENNKPKEKKEEENTEIKKQIEETKKYYDNVNKIKTDPDNKVLFNNNDNPIVFTPKMNETISYIDLLMKYFKSGSKSMFNTDKKIEYFNILQSAIQGYDFFPTPERIGEYLQKNIINDYRQGGRGFCIMDMCAGLGSLSLPLIKDMNQNEKIYLLEFYRGFVEILKGLENENIKVNPADVLEEPKEKYYNKCIDVIISNPPFTNTFYEKITPEEKKKLETWEEKNLGKGIKWTSENLPKNIQALLKKRTSGERKEDKMFYLYFLFKALDILENQHTNTQKTLYFICPLTLFKPQIQEDRWINKSDIGDYVDLKVPKATLERILKKLDLVGKYEEDEDFWIHCKFIDIVDGFKTIKGGKPVNLNFSFGFFEILPYNNQPTYIIN
jgi:hypothetical protein